MADFIRNPVVTLPDRNPAPHFCEQELAFTEEEKTKIARWVSQYPTPDGAVMWTLWLAQEKFGFLPPEVLRLVGEELGIPYAQVYGVATFYTQYYKQKKGVCVLDVCTCFSCQFTGGYDLLHYLEEKLGIHAGETTADGCFTLQEVECLGACGSAPMLQVSNGPFVHCVTRARADALIDALKAGRMPEFASVTLPQDEDELGGNRRTDVAFCERYATLPIAKHTR